MKKRIDYQGGFYEVGEKEGIPRADFVREGRQACWSMRGFSRVDGGLLLSVTCEHEQGQSNNRQNFSIDVSPDEVRFLMDEPSARVDKARYIGRMIEEGCGIVISPSEIAHFQDMEVGAGFNVILCAAADAHRDAFADEYESGAA